MTQELKAKLQKAAADALLVQNACNFSGVLNSLHEIVMTVLWPVANEEQQGSRFIARHAITVAFMDKLTSLAGIQDLGNPDVYKAFDECERLSKGE